MGFGQMGALRFTGAVCCNRSVGSMKISSLTPTMRSLGCARGLRVGIVFTSRQRLSDITEAQRWASDPSGAWS